MNIAPDELKAKAEQLKMLADDIIASIGGEGGEAAPPPENPDAEGDAATMPPAGAAEEGGEAETPEVNEELAAFMRRPKQRM